VQWNGPENISEIAFIKSVGLNSIQIELETNGDLEIVAMDEIQFLSTVATSSIIS